MLLAIFPIVAYRTYITLSLYAHVVYVQKKQVAGEVSLIPPGAVISEWLASLKGFRCKGVHR